MHQPRISDVCLAELERCEAGQALQVCEPQVGDLCAAEIQSRETAESREIG